MRSILSSVRTPWKFLPLERRTTNLRVECKLSYIESKGMTLSYNSSARVQNFFQRNEELAILAVFSRLVCNLIPILDESTWK